MKVRDLIGKLQEFDQDLPVCSADWNEEYCAPSELAAETIAVVEGKYNAADPSLSVYVLSEGKFVCIG